MSPKVFIKVIKTGMLKCQWYLFQQALMCGPVCMQGDKLVTGKHQCALRSMESSSSLLKRPPGKSSEHFKSPSIYAWHLCIFTPVTPATAFKFGEKSDPMQMYLSDVFTTALNLAGNCGISVPAGLDPDTHMPSGIQLIAPSLAEERLFKAARAFELTRPEREIVSPL